MNRNAIARQLHVSPSSVCRWLTGEHEPSYRNGTALVFLAGAERTPAPIRPDSASDVRTKALAFLRY